jgi:hypothetical protein
MQQWKGGVFAAPIAHTSAMPDRTGAKNDGLVITPKATGPLQKIKQAHIPTVVIAFFVRFQQKWSHRHNRAVAVIASYFLMPSF